MKRPTEEEDEVPIHRDMTPMGISVETWLKMTMKQRAQFLQDQADYAESLEQERRDERKRRFGY